MQMDIVYMNPKRTRLHEKMTRDALHNNSREMMPPPKSKNCKFVS